MIRTTDMAHDHEHQHLESHGEHGHGGCSLDHGHGHHHGPASYDRAFAIGIALNLGFVGMEAFYGFAVDSLALLADAGHNLSDVAGLLIAWAAAWLTKKRASKRRTYGLGRTTIMASLVNAVILLIGVGGIAWEAVLRLGHPQPVAGETVMWVAALGIAVNAGTAAMFMAGSKGDLNIRGAFLHMAADAAVSLGVVVAAFIMSRTGWLWLDPVVSLAIVVVIAVGTWGLFRESLNLALDAVPTHIDREAVEDFLMEVPGVVAIHDLHIWPLSTTSVALTAHLVKPNALVDDDVLHRVGKVLQDKFGIDHATIQLENGNGKENCRLTHFHDT
ncbi:cation transporter [Telmatospirillum siberiense]|uniref:Cation transporter n=2 Tax=Telmatospirillum siberiense TaxID=382514 RepID=A0A2N3PTX2_9PROT|nr:cation transporter [Telmatospirillum siberiense]